MNFTLSELIRSDTAIRYKMYNMPKTEEVLDNMFYLITECLQPIRDYVKKPIIISSGYRCPELNSRIGGVSTSQHTKGQAADFIIQGLSVNQAIELIKKSGIKYDQLINEYDKWVHISYNKKGNRQQCFKIT